MNNIVTQTLKIYRKRTEEAIQKKNMEKRFEPKVSYESPGRQRETIVLIK